MKYPKISLVTSCYNHAGYIAETVESILSQNYPNLQYVVIDDGSTDGSWEIIKKYKDKLFHCERLSGYRDTPTVALNYGLSKIDGEIMGWINSDDILLPRSLFTVAKIFEDNECVEWITGIATTINDRSEIINSRLRLKNKYDYLIGDWKIIQQESTFWKNELWKRVGGKLEGKYKWAFDTELWTRFFMINEHFHVNAPLGAFRKGRQSKSVSNFGSFSVPSRKYLKEMKTKCGLVLKFKCYFYFLSKKILWPILGLLPSRMISFLPILKMFAYKLIIYSFEQDKWIVKVINPFRKECD